MTTRKIIPKWSRFAAALVVAGAACVVPQTWATDWITTSSSATVGVTSGTATGFTTSGTVSSSGDNFYFGSATDSLTFNGANVGSGVSSVGDISCLHSSFGCRLIFGNTSALSVGSIYLLETVTVNSGTITVGDFSAFDVNVNGGTLNVGTSGASVDIRRDISVSGGGTLGMTISDPMQLIAPPTSLTLDGGTLAVSGTGIYDTMSFAVPVVLGSSGGTVYVGNGFNLIAGGGIDVSSTGDFTKTGAGTLTLSGMINHSGDTTVSAGTLQLNSDYAVGSGATLAVGSGATLTTGMLDSYGHLASNFTVDTGGTVDFDSGSTWHVKEDGSYCGSVLMFANASSTIDSDAANAALTLGNNRTQLYDFSYEMDSMGGYLIATAKESANVNDAVVTDIPLMFQYGAMFGTASGRASQQLDAGSTVGNAAVRGQECDPCAPACGRGGVGKLSVWTNYIGRSTELVANSKIAGLAGTAQITSDGVQFGADRLIGRRSVVGAMFSYERGYNALQASRAIGDNYAFSLFAAHQFSGGYEAIGLIGYGHQKYDSRRWDIDNLVFQTGKFAGNTFELTLEGGRRMRASSNLWLRPAVAFDLYNNDVAGYKEDGFGAKLGAVEFGKISLTQSFIRVGGDLLYRQDRFAMNGGFYYSHQMSANGNRVRTTINGDVNSFGSDLGRNKLTFKAAASYALGAKKALSVYGGYNGDYFADRAGRPWGHNAYVGTRYRF